MARKALKPYDMTAILSAYKQDGQPPYTTWHDKTAKEYEAEGIGFPALQTFKKRLEKEGLSDSKTTSSTKKRANTEGRVVVEPLTEQERRDYETFDKVDFADWVIEHKPGVWRDFFSKDKKFELLQANYEAALEEIAALKAKLPKHGNQ